MHLPARVRRTRRGLRIDPQQQDGHARLLGRQRQPAGGGEIEHARVGPAFHQHRTQPRTTRRIRRTTQQHHRIGRDSQQQPVRIAAQFAETRSVKPAAYPFGVVATQP